MRLAIAARRLETGDTLRLVRVMLWSLLVAGVFVAWPLVLALLVAISAWAGGANVGRPALRPTFRGALAIALTAGIGALFGTVVFVAHERKHHCWRCR